MCDSTELTLIDLPVGTILFTIYIFFTIDFHYWFD